ncbi:hypothetical protein JL720_2167 [Aureococcus anophagefferens]|nr:hypothetical protein JL720_2167 [Aureococcus anophagefferens]
MVARRLLAVTTALLVAYADDVAQQQEEDFQAMKCSACCSIVAELERNLETEKPRMNVDLRNTLSGGKQGKVVDYAAKRAADADAAGEAPADHRAVLGVAPDAAVDEIKRAYRRLSRELHPDRTGGDPGALRDFVRVAAAHEALTGEAHRPYDDLYSDVCLRIAGVCDDDADVDAAKEFFPRYDGSSKFPPTKKNTGPDHCDDLTGKKKKRRRKKAAKKEL